MSQEQNGDLEEARKKKIEEMKQEQARRQEEAKLDALVRRIVEDKAYDRLSNVKSVKGYEFYRSVVQQLLMYYQQYRVRLSDERVRQILAAISSSSRKEYKFHFVRK